MIPEFHWESMFQNYVLRQQIVFPTIWAETSGSHTNFSRRICLNGSNPLTFQRFGEIGRFFFAPRPVLNEIKELDAYIFRIFQKSHNSIKYI